MRLLLTSMHCPKGEIATNLASHLAMVSQGAEAGADLVLLPEMSLTGYRPGAAIDLDDAAVEGLVAATSDAPALCFGLVERDPGGGPPYITQVVAADGELATVHRKAHLGEGEDIDFQPGARAEVFELGGLSMTIAVCAEIGSEAPYESGASLVLGPAAPGLYGPRRRTQSDWQRGFAWWRGNVADDARRLLRPDQLLAVSTQAGATDDEDFPGWAAVVGPDGAVVGSLPDWRPGTLIIDL